MPHVKSRLIELFQHLCLKNKQPLDLGKQSWEGRRLIYLYVDKQSLNMLPESIGDLSSIEVLSLNNNNLIILLLRPSLN